MESPQVGLTEGVLPQNGSEFQDATADPAGTEVLPAQTQNCRSVCADPLSRPAGSSPDREGLQSRGRNEDKYFTRL